MILKVQLFDDEEIVTECLDDFVLGDERGDHRLAKLVMFAALDLRARHERRTFVDLRNHPEATA